MRILGIDPGLATVGLGLIETTSHQNSEVIDWLTIETQPHEPSPTRLREIHDDLATFLEESQPDLAVVERLYFATNAKTAMSVAEARGVILYTLQCAKIEIKEPTPLEIKFSLTGDGSADKRQVQDMLVRMFGLREVPTPDDAADALAMAVYGSLLQVPDALQTV